MISDLLFKCLQMAVIRLDGSFEQGLQVLYVQLDTDHLDHVALALISL